MKTNHAHVFFSRGLLRLDETGGAIDADDETPSDLRVKCSRMSRLFDTEDPFDPGDDLVTGWVGGFVEVDDTGGDVIFEVASEGGGAAGDGCVVGGADVKVGIVAEEEGPFRGVEFGCVVGGGDHGGCG